VAACQRDGCKQIEDRAEERDDDREGEGGDGTGQLFIARGIEGIGDERGGSDSEKDGDEKIAGAEGAQEIGFSDAQYDERDKFEDEA